MIQNTQAYLQQIKDTNFINLVQSQNYPILSQLIGIFNAEGSVMEKINSTDTEGFTALHMACARGIMDIVDLLIDYGADVNARNIGGETPAHLAARRGSPACLSLLKDHNANLEQTDNKGQNIVHNAVLGDGVLVLLWIESSTNISFKSKDSSGLTPLHLSCIHGKTNCIKFFLRKSRIDILEKTTHRDNCLHLLIKHQHMECIPPILLNLSRKTSVFSIDQAMKDNKSLILTSKNSDNKTPLDLFDDLPSQYKDSHRIFHFLFFMLQMSSLKQLEYNFLAYRIILFLLPFLSFLVGILLSVYIWPQYKMTIYPAVTLILIIFVRTQSHRISKLDTGQNPIFAGAYLAGIFHDLFCFRVNIYPHLTTQWEIILTAFLLPLLTLCYLRLICVDPGKLQISEVSTDNFSKFLSGEISKQKLNNHQQSFTVLPLDKFCQICEVAPSVGRVKHCKLCDICVVNIDHHCLFLMKCVARNNIRNFVFLIMFSLALIGLFLLVSMKIVIIQCGPMSGANPLSYLYCGYSRETWIATGMIINAGSFIWGFVMLISQLQSISQSSTYYYRMRHGLRVPLSQRLIKILYFLTTGKYHVSNEEKRLLDI